MSRYRKTASALMFLALLGLAPAGHALAALNTHHAALQESVFWYATPVGAMMLGVPKP